MKKSSINTQVENYESIFLDYLNRFEDEKIYNTFLEINKDKKTMLTTFYFYFACINLSINGFNIPRKYLEQAIVDFKKLKKSSINYYNIGNAYLGLEFYSKAIDNFKKSIQLDDLNAEVYKNLGGCYQSIGKDKEEYHNYLKAFTLNPQLFEAILSLGIYEIKMNNNYKKALSYFDKIIFERLTDNRKYTFYCWKTYLHFSLKEYEKCITYIECALELKHKNHNYILEFGCYVYTMIEDKSDQFYKLKISFFEKYILKYPTSDKGYAQLAYAYYKLSSETQIDYTLKSKQAFLKAISLGYKDGIKGLVWDRLGHLEEYLGNDSEAEEYFKEAVLLNEKNFSYCLGSCFIKQKKYKEALPYLEKSAKEYIPDELSWFNLGICYVNLNKINNGKEAFEKAITINPEYDSSYFELGGILFNQKNYFEASKIWTKAIAKFPNNSRVKIVEKLLHQIKNN